MLSTDRASLSPCSVSKMADVLLEKDIYFLGSWKANRLSDHLLHDITAHGKDNRGAPSTLQVLPLGIKLHVKEKSQKSGIIPERNVLEIKQNRFQSETMLCVVKDDSTLLLGILVWRCANESDVFDILKCFNGTHNNNNNSLSNGHGVVVSTTDPKSNSNQGNSNVFINGDVSTDTHRYRKKSQGRSVVTSTLQHTVTTNSDVQNTATNESKENNVKVFDLNSTVQHQDELHQIRSDDIEKVKVVDFHSNVQKKEDLDQIKVVHVPRGSTSSQTQEDDVITHTRSVNFSENITTFPQIRDVSVQTDMHDTDGDSLALSTSGSLKDEISSLQKEVKELRLIVESSVAISNAEYIRRKQLSDSLNSDSVHSRVLNEQIVQNQYDSRSFASQTEATRRVYEQAQAQARQQMTAVRRTRVQSEPRYLRQSQNVRSLQIPTRSQRYQSDSAMHTNYGYRLVPRHQVRSASSSSSGSLTKKMMRYVTLPPDGRIKKEMRQYPRKSGLFLNSTVERPIEDVYSGQSRGRKRFEQSYRRSRQVITPQTFAVNSNGVPVASGDLISPENDDYQKIVDMKRQQASMQISEQTGVKQKEPEMKLPEAEHHNVHVENQAT